MRRPPNLHGTPLLATSLSGRLTTEPDGTRFDKWIWVAAPTFEQLGVTYRRLDAAEPAKQAETIRGQFSIFDGPSWAARMYFTEGCWLIRGSLRDVSVSFVVQVARP